MKYHFLYLFLLLANVACGQTQPQKKIPKDTTSQSVYTEGHLIELGLKYIESEAYGKALKMCNQAIQINPDYLDAYLTRAICYKEMGNFTKAIADLEFVLKEDKGNPLAFNNLANVFFSRNDSKTAIEYYNKAIQVNTNYANAYYNRGLAYNNMDNIEKACVDWKKAASLGHRKAKKKLITHCRK